MGWMTRNMSQANEDRGSVPGMENDNDKTVATETQDDEQLVCEGGMNEHDFYGC